MLSKTETNLADYCSEVASRAKAASRELVQVSTETKDRWLLNSADRLQRATPELLAANAVDIDRASEFGLTDAAIDRLKLNENRILEISHSLRALADLPDPIGEVIEKQTRPNGLQVTKIRVPLGVLFFIYESRPNVTADAAGIALKSGNAIILRGGKEAYHSSKAIVDVLQLAGSEIGIPSGAIQLVSTSDRNALDHFLKLDRLIDLAIPRGGEGLVRRVVAEARMPVLKHYDGNCHLYVDASADLESSLRIVENAKCQRMGVCNALESLLVHRSIASHFLPNLRQRLASRSIELRGDDRTREILPDAEIANEDDWTREYLGPILSIRVVDSLDQAIAHINHYGSHHTDGILTQDSRAAEQFALNVDSAAVMINASTRFNDGGQLGMGAEIGISTDKFHARGPCGLRELTTYKYIIHGTGQTRD